MVKKLKNENTVKKKVHKVSAKGAAIQLLLKKREEQKKRGTYNR